MSAVAAGHPRDELTLEQAAQLLGLSPRTLARLANARFVPGWREGEQWQFSRRELTDWLARGGDY